MSRPFRTVLGLLAIGVAACAGCGSGDDATPNPALGPPPVIKPERGATSVPTPAPPPAKPAKLPARK